MSDILYFASRPPHPNGKGDALTTYHYVRLLAERGWRVQLRSLRWWGDDLPAVVPDLGGGTYEEATVARRHLATRSVIAQLVRGWPLQAAVAEPAMRRLMGPLLAAHGDTAPIYGHYLRTTLPLLSAGVDPERVIAGLQLSNAVNLERLAQRRKRVDPRRWLTEFEARRCARAERSLAAGAVVFSSPGDVEYLGVGGRPEVHVIPHGVDTGPTPTHHTGAVTRRQPVIAMSGVMSFAPNASAARWFATEAFPEIRRRIPDALFRIVGRDPGPALTSLAGDHIEVTGTVVSVADELRRASVAVVPVTIAAGMQNKLLEAAEAGCAIVTAPEANVATAFPVSGPDQAVVEAHTVEDWIDAVVALLERPDDCHRLGAAARRRVVEEWSWERRFDPIEALLQPHAMGAQR